MGATSYHGVPSVTGQGLEKEAQPETLASATDARNIPTTLGVRGQRDDVGFIPCGTHVRAGRNVRGFKDSAPECLCMRKLVRLLASFINKVLVIYLI